MALTPDKIHSKHDIHPNQSFWYELCGTQIFKSLGLAEVTPTSIQKFDAHYLKYYSFLLDKYIDIHDLHDKKKLEIGLGFGTVGNILLKNSKEYTALDYSKGPVNMMNTGISWAQKEKNCTSIQGSALQMPFENNTFDYVVSIGCLHHTGDTQRCIH